MQNSSRRPWPLLSRRRRGSNRRRRRRRRGSIVFDRFVFLCVRFFFFCRFSRQYFIRGRRRLRKRRGDAYTRGRGNNGDEKNKTL